MIMLVRDRVINIMEWVGKKNKAQRFIIPLRNQKRARLLASLSAGKKWQGQWRQSGPDSSAIEEWDVFDTLLR